MLSNANKFTENGYIEYGAVLKDKSVIEFYVKDNGKGIPKDKQDLINKIQNNLKKKIENYISGKKVLGLFIQTNLVYIFMLMVAIPNKNFL